MEWKLGLLLLFILVIWSAVAEEETEELKERRKRQISREAYQGYLRDVQNPNYDPRAEEGWYLLYPYGKWVMDDHLMGQPGRETQANLGFDFPFYGYRYNYTFVYPMGMISFARPPFIQPPFTFPNPLWPRQRDHAFIAPFYADAAFQWIGNTRISNTWFRSVHRPRLDNDEFYDAYNPFVNQQNNPSNPFSNQQFGQNLGGGQYQQRLPNPNPQTGVNPSQYNPQPYRTKRQMPGRLNQNGMVVDPMLLNNITRDVQNAYNGAHGWRAEHAFIVTWERMAYGGAAKAVDVSQYTWVKQWQNTFQLVVAADHGIRSFAIFNYARLNWTTSMEAGGLNGFGGKQAAMAGFNGGNGTAWYPLPYSGHGRIWKLGYFTNGIVPGRWIHRIDEQIIPGGCTNASTGYMITSPPYGPMQGGITVNITGPCLRPRDFVKVVFENWPTDCRRMNSMLARCVMPMFHKTGLVPIRMSRDGGQSYPFVGWFYVLQPLRAPAQIMLRDDVENPRNRWHQPDAEQLTLEWQFLNLTWNMNTRVDINLFGYWEDADRSHFLKIDSIAQGQANNGRYTFSPRSLMRNPKIADAWKKFHFGFLQIAVSGVEEAGVLWSKPTPFPWYYLPTWQSQYGSNWALDMCIDWFEYDGRRRNFIMDLTSAAPCPCRMEQALLDLGRFMPLFECDKDGDASCPFNKGAQHCIQSVQPSWTGASQQCCYDYQGFLMFSDDWEPTGDYLRFFNPGTPARAHAFGSYPYKRPPRIPGMSNYQLDSMPYRMCCNYAEHCEFYYWRRQTNGCQDYFPPGAAYIYGEPHIVTFDGIRYTFPGKGFYVLLMSEDPYHKLMIQVRLEQPDQTLWHENVNATVVTGVVVQENNSDTVQVFARKDFRRWRYKTDVLVNGIPRYFDKPHWKIQQFNGIQIRNPKRNMNQSDLIIMTDSGAGVRVSESYGMLDIMVILPPAFNSTCNPNQPGGSTGREAYNPYTGRRCYITKGLLGSFNGDKTDDLQTIDGSTVRVPDDTYTRSTTQMIYEQFGKKWEVTGADPRIGPILFQTERFKPIYNPLLFASDYYLPVFGVDRVPINATLIFSMEEVRTVCAGNQQCLYDYIMTGRREIAITTLDYHKKFIGLQRRGSKFMVSCGPLLKKEGIIKTPPAQNYLDGDVVTFSCKPDFFIHGDIVRRCVNGTWTPGWWAWCRDRNLEYALKWLTGLLTVFAFFLLMGCIFCCCWRRRVRLQKGQGYQQGQPVKKQPPPPTNYGVSHGEPPPAFNGDSYEHEPRRVGLAGNGHPTPMVTSA